MSAAAALLLVGAALQAAPEAMTPAAPPPATAKRAAPRPTPEKPPLDFTGVWEIDEKASLNVSPAMKGETLNVRQTGSQIWISSMDPQHSRVLSESIVVDGQSYEKTLGTKGKGLVTAAWAKDHKSLWIEVTAGPAEDPRRIVERSVWKLSSDRQTWVRQSVSIQEGTTREARVVLHRQKKPRAKSPTPSAGRH